MELAYRYFIDDDIIIINAKPRILITEIMSLTLNNPIAVIAKDWKMYPYYGGSKILDSSGNETFRMLIPFRDQIAREQGFYKWWEAYNDLLRDPHLKAVDEKRRKAVIIRPWKIVPASQRSQDKKVAHWVEKTLREIGHGAASEKKDYVTAQNPDGFNTICFKLLNFYFYGFSVANIVWGFKTDLVKVRVPKRDRLVRGAFVYLKRKGDYQECVVKKVKGEEITVEIEREDDDPEVLTVTRDRLFKDKEHKFIVPIKIQSRYQGRFGAKLKGEDEFELVSLTREHPLGESLGDNRGFITCFYNEDERTPLGSGIAPCVYHAVQFKRRLEQFSLGYADRFGSPQAIAKYPANQPAMKNVLEGFLKQMGQEGYGVLPQEAIVEFLSAGGQGNKIYAELIDHLNNEISKAVLGETGTTDQQTGGGSRARDQVGNDVRIEIAAGDAMLLAETLNASLIPWLVAINFGDKVRSPRIEWSFPELSGQEDINAKAGRDVMLMQAMQLKPTVEYIEKTYGLPLQEPKRNPSEGGLGALFAGMGESPEGGGDQSLPPEGDGTESGDGTEPDPAIDAELDALENDAEDEMPVEGEATESRLVAESVDQSQFGEV